jgi:hypothetical protein
MIVHGSHLPASRRTKLASVLQLGDAIRLESGKRVVIDYVSRGFTPTDRYIEWRGHGSHNWANVPLDTPVRLAWRVPRARNFIFLARHWLLAFLAIIKIVLAGFWRAPHPR